MSGIFSPLWTKASPPGPEAIPAHQEEQQKLSAEGKAPLIVPGEGSHSGGGRAQQQSPQSCSQQAQGDVLCGEKALVW